MKHHISLPGRVPSKKNSKVFNIKMKRLFSSSSHREWESSMLKHLMVAGHKPVNWVSSISMNFNFPDMRKTDLTNKAESVMDLLVRAGIINDDCWQAVPELILHGTRDKSIQVGCEITISEKE